MTQKNNSCKKYTMELIGDHRVFLMGIATAMVVLFHSNDLDFYSSGLLLSTKVAAILDFIKENGYAGVDIFLLLSGYGLYYSISGDRNIVSFYRRRFYRVGPPIILVSAIFYGWLGTGSLSEWAQKVFLYGFWLHSSADRGRYWYFSLLIVLYLVFPVFYRIISKMDWKGMLLLIAAVVVFTFIIKSIDPDYFRKVEIALTRIPVFVMGIWLGKQAFEKRKYPEQFFRVITIAGLFYIGFLFYFTRAYTWVFWHRYLFFPLAFFMVIGISYIRSKIRLNMVDGAHILAGVAVTLLGVYSLEVYLIYEQLYLYLKEFYRTSDQIGISYALACFATTFVLAVVLHQVTELIARQGAVKSRIIAKCGTKL